MKLTLENVKAACRKAYKARMLLAQHPHLEYGYERRDKNRVYHCAIGCALDRPTLDNINENNEHSNLISGLFNTGVVEVDFAELSALMEIQQAHDNWLRDRKISPRYKTEYRYYFLKLINEE
jgi:hypothetical protein